MRNVIIKSNLKTYFANPVTGENIGQARYGNHVITRFDLVEFSEAYGDPRPDTIDIIDIGYWFYEFGDDSKVLRYEHPLWHQREHLGKDNRVAA